MFIRAKFIKYLPVLSLFRTDEEGALSALMRELIETRAMLQSLGMHAMANQAKLIANSFIGCFSGNKGSNNKTARQFVDLFGAVNALSFLLLLGFMELPFTQVCATEVSMTVWGIYTNDIDTWMTVFFLINGASIVLATMYEAHQCDPPPVHFSVWKRTKHLILSINTSDLMFYRLFHEI